MERRARQHDRRVAPRRASDVRSILSFEDAVRSMTIEELWELEDPIDAVLARHGVTTTGCQSTHNGEATR
jgi:hypothetical protein